MKRFFTLFLIVGTLVCHAQEMDIIEHLKSDVNGWFESISVTSTAIVFQTHRPLLYSLYEKNSPPLASQHKDRIPEQKETIILTPNFEFFFGDGRHVFYLFTPVTFINNVEGFRVFDISDSRSFGRAITIKTWYVALSDTSVSVGEEDLTDESHMLSKQESFWWQEAMTTQKEYEEQQERQKKENEEFQEKLRTNKELAQLFVDLREMQNKYMDKMMEAHGHLQGEALMNRLAELQRESELEKKPLKSRIDILLAPPPPCLPASRAWLWWLALPVVAGAWLAFHLGRRRK